VIKQISELQFGDLIFWDGDTWIACEGDQDSRVILHEYWYRRPRRLMPCDGPVPVFAQRSNYESQL
jgi:hypothetical protein